MPENWVDAPPGKWKLLLGKDAHNGWNMADPTRPVSDVVRWLVGGSESPVDTVLFWLGYALHRLRVAVFGKPASPRRDDAKEADDGEVAASGSGASSASAGAAGRKNALKKRLYACAGLLGVFVTWTIFAWCAAPAAGRSRRFASLICPVPAARPPPPWSVTGSSLCVHGLWQVHYTRRPTC
jgi:hypothetical protein